MTPATDWQKRVGADETQQFERFAAELGAIQAAIAAKQAPPDRALHAKGLAGVAAEFRVIDGLPDHARVGIFATPQTLRAYVRFSNGAPRRQRDSKPDLRGLALKLVGVPGAKIIPGMEDCQTHDFLMIHNPTALFRSVDEFMLVLRHGEAPLKLIVGLIKLAGFGRAFALLGKLAKVIGKPVLSAAQTRYYSAAPMQWGKFAVHCGLVPHLAAGAPLDKAADDPVAQDLVARLKQGAVTYDFVVQFFVDEAQTPIEDPSVGWPESASPPLKVAELTLLQQDMTSASGRALQNYVEGLSFDPWHAPVEFKPLGAIMRARNVAYRTSTMARKALPEPAAAEVWIS